MNAPELLFGVVVYSGDIQDADGLKDPLWCVSPFQTWSRAMLAGSAPSAALLVRTLLSSTMIAVCRVPAAHELPKRAGHTEFF